MSGTYSLTQKGADYLNKVMKDMSEITITSARSKDEHSREALSISDRRRFVDA